MLIFKHIIVPRRAHLVKEVVFDEDENDPEHLKEFLFLLHVFANLRVWTINQTTLDILLGPMEYNLDVGDEDAEIILLSSQKVASKVTGLTLRQSHALGAWKILTLFPSLVKIEFLDCPIFDIIRNAEGKETPLVGNILASYPLEHLSIVGAQISIQIPASILDNTWLSASTLRSLVLYQDWLSTPNLQFISIFSASLTSLTISSSIIRLDPLSRFTCGFYKLRYLYVRTVSDLIIKPLVKLFSSSPLVSINFEFHQDLPAEDRR